MKVVSIADVVAINKELAEKSVACKVHLRDACGRQTLWLELNDNSPESLEQAQRIVTAFFDQRGYELEFDPTEGINFWVRQ